MGGLFHGDAPPSGGFNLGKSSAALNILSFYVCVYIFTHWTDDRGWAPPTPPTTFFRQGDPAHRRVRATERSRSRFFFFFFFFLSAVCVVFLFFSHSFFFHLFFFPLLLFRSSFFYFSSKLQREAQSFINRKVGRIALDHLLLDSNIFSVFFSFDSLFLKETEKTCLRGFSLASKKLRNQNIFEQKVTDRQTDRQTECV